MFNINLQTRIQQLLAIFGITKRIVLILLFIFVYLCPKSLFNPSFLINCRFYYIAFFYDILFLCNPSFIYK